MLYPHHAELGEWKPKRAAYLLNGLDESDATLKQRISVSTVDLRDLRTVPSQLKQVVHA